MTSLNIRKELAERLLGVAERENRSVEEILERLLDSYRAGEAAQAENIESATPQPKTGAEIAAMLTQMEPIEFSDSEITDPVAWVNAQRRREAERLKPYWDGLE